MARMSVDDAVLRDPRITILAHLCGWSRRETLGCLIEVWAVCYDRIDCSLGRPVIDLIAQREGFGELMLEAELATRTPSGKLRIAGAKERIGYLTTLKQYSREGGLKSAESRRSKSKGRLNGTDSVAVNASSPDPSPSPVPDLPPASPPDPVLKISEKNMSTGVDVPVVGNGKAKKQPAYSPEELAIRDRVLERLGKRVNVRYEGSKKHTELIVARLREGRTEDDLRRIVAYCAEALGWQDENHKLHHCLRPETLFGPETIERYVYKAREYRKSEAITQEASHG